jgi:hypothetical protein
LGILCFEAAFEQLVVNKYGEYEDIDFHGIRINLNNIPRTDEMRGLSEAKEILLAIAIKCVSQDPMARPAIQDVLGQLSYAQSKLSAEEVGKVCLIAC